MNVLIYTQSYYVRKTFVNALIPNGISLFHVEDLTNMLSKIKEKAVNIVVYDVIQENYDEIFRSMRELKKFSEKKIAVLLFIGAVDKTQVAKALQFGAVGFIKSNAKESTISKYIQEISEKIEGVPPERKFVRLTLDSTNEHERVSVKFRSPRNMQIILGIVKDISAGGIAVELVGTFDPDAIEVGLETHNIQFMLDGKDVLTDGIIVAYKKRFCAFRFVNTSIQDLEIISEFIFERI